MIFATVERLMKALGVYDSGLSAGIATLDSGGKIPDAQIPAAIARDTEVATTMSDHVAAANPHPTYATDADLSAHVAAGDPHPVYLLKAQRGAANGVAPLDSESLLPSENGGDQPGDIKMTARPTAGPGFLLCDGAAISRTTYARLFAAIGVVYGVGDGTTTFNLPDLRGRAPIGAGAGPSLTARALGGKGGAETHQLIASEMPSHTHEILPLLAGNSVAAGNYLASTLNDDNFGSAITGPAGGNTAHNNMQPWAALNFIIKI